MSRGKRVYGPYERNGKWRIVGIRADGSRVYTTFDTEAGARAELAKIVTKIEGRTLGTLVDEYLEHKLRDGNRASGVKTVGYNLRNILRLPHEDGGLSALTPYRAASLYSDLVSRTAVATHHKCLEEATRLMAYAVKRGYVDANPFDSVERVGRKTMGRGKAKYRIDELRAMLDACLNEGTLGGLFTAVHILTGARVSELLERVARDVDDGGAIIWVDDAKTDDSVRPLFIARYPGHNVRLRLSTLASSLEPTAPLWGESPSVLGHKTRGWAQTHFERLCKAAGVPVFTSHAFRRTFATMARASGETAQAVADSIGHATTSEQDRSYVSRGTGGIADTLRVTDRLLRRG